MRISSAPNPVISAAATTLARASTEYAAGANRFEATDLASSGWETRFTAAVRAMNDDWMPGWQAVQQARASVAALGADPVAAAALAQLDAVIRHTTRGWDYIGQTFMNLPRPLTPEFAQLAAARVGQAGRSIATVMADAARAVAALVADAPR